MQNYVKQFFKKDELLNNSYVHTRATTHGKTHGVIKCSVRYVVQLAFSPGMVTVILVKCKQHKFGDYRLPVFGIITI